MTVAPAFYQNDPAVPEKAEHLSGEMHDSVCQRMIEHREGCDDWHVNCKEEGERIEIRSQESSGPNNNREGIFLVSKRHEKLAGRGEHRVYFNDHSLRQFCDSLKFPISMVEKLRRDRNLKLLAQNMNHYLHSSESEYLLRLRKQEVPPSSPACYELRAFLPADYNRLDNIYLLSGLHAACSEYGLHWKDLYYDLDNFTCHLVVPGDEKPLLQEVGDKFISGISIENSEIGRLERGMDSFVAKIYFERLICKNGMTSNHTVNFRIRNRLNLGTNYPDKLPPYPLDKNLQAQIDEFLKEDVIGGLKEHIDENARQIQREAQQMHATRVEVQSPDHAKAIIREILRETGMIFYYGVSVNYIYEAFLEEYSVSHVIADPPVFVNITAWIFYNAITRYASNLIMGRNNFPRNYRLGSRFTRQSHMLSDTSVDWGRIQRRAERRMRGAPPEVVTPPAI